jgi:hypothetical protein
VVEKDVEISDCFANTALHYCLTARAVDFVFQNMKETKNMEEKRNSFGFTPLMHCFAVGSREAMQGMLGCNCDPTRYRREREKIILFLMIVFIFAV